ncbi:hypothetical protein KI387_011133, partial [Taxus chinensis]
MGNQSEGIANLNLEVRELLVGNVERKDMQKKDCWSKDKENQQPDKGKEANLVTSE